MDALKKKMYKKMLKSNAFELDKDFCSQFSSNIYFMKNCAIRPYHTFNFSFTYLFCIYLYGNPLLVLNGHAVEVPVVCIDVGLLLLLLLLHLPNKRNHIFLSIVLVRVEPVPHLVAGVAKLLESGVVVVGLVVVD